MLGFVDFLNMFQWITSYLFQRDRRRLSGRYLKPMSQYFEQLKTFTPTTSVLQSPEHSPYWRHDLDKTTISSNKCPNLRAALDKFKIKRSDNDGFVRQAHFLNAASQHPTLTPPPPICSTFVTKTYVLPGMVKDLKPAESLESVLKSTSELLNKRQKYPRYYEYQPEENKESPYPSTGSVYFTSDSSEVYEVLECAKYADRVEAETCDISQDCESLSGQIRKAEISSLSIQKQNRELDTGNVTGSSTSHTAVKLQTKTEKENVPKLKQGCDQSGTFRDYSMRKHRKKRFFFT